MKYWIFSMALAGLPVAAAALAFNRKWMRYALMCMIIPALFFDQSAINFCSRELYRGTSRGMEISIIYIAAAAVLAAVCVHRGMRSPAPTPGAVLYLLYFCCTLPSVANAENRLFCFFEAWKMVMLYLVFLAAFYYLKDTLDFDAVMYALAVVVFVNFLVVVKQHFTGIHQAHGVFPHQNSMAMYLMAAGNLMFARFFNREEPQKSVFFLFAFICATGALFRTYSRGAMICYPLSLVLTASVSMFFSFRTRMIRLCLLLAAIGFAGLLLFLPKIVDRFENAPESSGSMRKNFAIAALNMIRDKPLAGVGLNNWGIKINPPYEYSEHRDPERGFTEDYKDGIVETIYLLTAAECGIPCLLLLLAWLGYYWFVAFRLLKFLRGSPYFFLSAGLLGGLSGLYLQSLLEWVLRQQINFSELMILFAMLGVLNFYRRKIKQRYRTAPSYPPAFPRNVSAAGEAARSFP